MKEKPILFTGPMVRAILDGRKAQTRRLIKPQPKGDRKIFVAYPDGQLCDETLFENVICRYRPGDHLWVKENVWMWCEKRPNGTTKTGRPKFRYVPLRSAPFHYRLEHPSKPKGAIVSPDTGNQWGWRMKVGRFMPRWASRLTLEITRVRVERVQEITEQDAIAEGLEPGLFGGSYKAPGFALARDAIGAYEALWDSIRGEEHPWSSNPWVWVVEFKVKT